MIAGSIPSSCRNRAMPDATSRSLVDRNLLLCDLELHIDHRIDEPSPLLSQFIRNRSSREVAHVLEERVKCWQRQSGMRLLSSEPCAFLQDTLQPTRRHVCIERLSLSGFAVPAISFGVVPPSGNLGLGSINGASSVSDMSVGIYEIFRHIYKIIKKKVISYCFF